MSRKLTLSAEARQELREAVSWYEARGVGLGRQLLEEARECFHRIDTQPETGSPVKGVKEAVGARRVLLKRFPYAVIYIELEEQARVLAFAHMRRRPGYWKKR